MKAVPINLQRVVYLIDWLLRLSKNAGATFSKGKDTYDAAEVVKEQLLVHPK